MTGFVVRSAKCGCEFEFTGDLLQRQATRTCGTHAGAGNIGTRVGLAIRAREARDAELARRGLVDTREVRRDGDG